MGIDQIIKRIIIEETTRSSKVQSMIERIGFLNTVKVFGGIDNFKKIYGERLDKNKKIDFLKDIVNRNSTGLGVLDLFEFDIYISVSRDTDIRDIYSDGTYMSRTYEWDEEYQEWEMDNFYERYYNLEILDEHIIDQIIMALIKKL